MHKNTIIYEHYSVTNNSSQCKILMVINYNLLSTIIVIQHHADYIYFVSF